MFIAAVAIVIVVALYLLCAKAVRPPHPLLATLRQRGIRPSKTDVLLCRQRSFVSAGQLMTAREQRFLQALERVTDRNRWRLCPQVRVADVVRVSPEIKKGTREWWQLFRLTAQWHCDVVVTDRKGGLIVAIELDDSTHQAKQRQRRDLLLEEILMQAGIPLLRGKDPEKLVRTVAAYLNSLGGVA